MKEPSDHDMESTCRNLQLELAGLDPDATLAPEIEEHLALCDHCREVRLVDDDVWRALDDYRAPAAPESLLAKVEHRLAQPADELARERARRASRRVSVGFAAAAAAVILLGAGTGAWVGARGAGLATDRAAAQAAGDALVEQADLFSVDPPGSLTRAYALLEKGDQAP
jgi:predicted anti-sigma-YlaC factor YlaD